ncbi:hypothetical protein [Pararhodobacter oceanensis]|uniref:hypothetical protein n=1 Tax=Pararhodobacter oceanensis TaxID=2172121 RepID=UPI003A90041F
MFWETIAACVLLLGAFPLWFFAAILWGAFVAVTALIHAVFSTGSGWDDIWAVPVGAVLVGFEAAWSVPSWIWNWAKYEHPWWAVVIGVTIIALAGESRR